MRLRVMTYNLLYAFHEREGDTWVHRGERARAAREVVRTCAPDVLGITEAVYCGGGRGRLIRPDYAEMFGLPHVHAAGIEGDWGNCIVSRFPILSAECIPLGRGRLHEVTSSALRVRLDCEGREVHVDVVHPSPGVTEAERVEAFVPLLASLKRPYLLIGDLNSLSDEDPYEHATLVSQLSGRVDDPSALATRMLDRQLVASIRSHGLRDFAPPARQHTLPTRLQRKAIQGARLRIDYVFGSDEFRAERVEVVVNELSDRVSDHYPLVAELELS